MLNTLLLKELKEFVRANQEIIVLESAKIFEYEENNILYDMTPIELEDFVKKNRQPSLKEVLFRFIDRKGASDADIYKKAGIDRKHFSKIRSQPYYRPKKTTIVALAFALELNKEDTNKLLSSAGYSLSDSDTYDLVIQFCLKKKIYDMDEVNQALDYFSLKPLTGF